MHPKAAFDGLVIRVDPGFLPAMSAQCDHQADNIKNGLLLCALHQLLSRGFLVGACLHDQHAVLLLGWYIHHAPWGLHPGGSRI